MFPPKGVACLNGAGPAGSLPAPRNGQAAGSVCEQEPLAGPGPLPAACFYKRRRCWCSPSPTFLARPRRDQLTPRQSAGAARGVESSSRGTQVPL